MLLSFQTMGSTTWKSARTGYRWRVCAMGKSVTCRQCPCHFSQHWSSPTSKNRYISDLEAFSLFRNRCHLSNGFILLPITCLSWCALMISLSECCFFPSLLDGDEIIERHCLQSSTSSEQQWLTATNQFKGHRLQSTTCLPHSLHIAWLCKQTLHSDRTGCEVSRASIAMVTHQSRWHLFLASNPDPFCHQYRVYDHRDVLMVIDPVAMRVWVRGWSLYFAKRCTCFQYWLMWNGILYCRYKWHCMLMWPFKVCFTTITSYLKKKTWNVYLMFFSSIFRLGWKSRCWLTCVTIVSFPARLSRCSLVHSS